MADLFEPFERNGLWYWVDLDMNYKGPYEDHEAATEAIRQYADRLENGSD